VFLRTQAGRKDLFRLFLLLKRKKKNKGRKRNKGEKKKNETGKKNEKV